MVRESKIPAIDVASDASKLKRKEIIDALIAGHVDGIGKYLGLKKKEGMSVSNRDIYVVSSWAAAAWDVAKKEGLFDGSRPGDPLIREEAAIVFLRLEKSILQKLNK